MWTDTKGPGPQLYEYLLSKDADKGNFEYGNESESLLVWHPADHGAYNLYSTETADVEKGQGRSHSWECH